jgi:hypothetical protein
MLVVVNKKYTYECSFPVNVGDRVKLPKGDGTGFWIGKITALQSEYAGPVKQVLCFEYEEVPKAPPVTCRSIFDEWKPSDEQ